MSSARVLPALLLLSCLGACASPPRPPPVNMREAERVDRLNRLSEYLAQSTPEDPVLLLNSLERMMIDWQVQQRKGQAQPLENLVNRKVVAGFDSVADAFRGGPHERKLVAAWALGFARVPDNPLGIPSRHAEALALLVPALQDAPDDIMRNVTLALWKLGDPATPLPPLLDLVVNHHDPEVRANATLALTTVLTAQSAPLARDTVLVALTDNEPKVRLHAAAVAANHPDETTSRRLNGALKDEQVPLVRASIARALGKAKDRACASKLAAMLDSPRSVESTSAHAALIEIFGTDHGMTSESWEGYIE